MAETWKTYIVKYQFDGDEYSIDIPARSWEEAEQRLQRIGLAGKVEGEVAMKIELPFFGLFQWLKRQ